MARDILVAKDSAVFEIDGTPVFIAKGSTAREGHPVLKGREYLWETLVPDFEHIPSAPKKDQPPPAQPAAAAGAQAGPSEGVEAPPPPPPPPSAAAAKSEWVDFAVSQGEDRAFAEARTKSDLQAQYGGR